MIWNILYTPRFIRDFRIYKLEFLHKEKLQKNSHMEESVYQQEKLWKEVLDLSIILTQIKSIMSALPVNVTRCLAIQTLFGHENPKFNTDNAST